jgi:hypothetical protein
VSAPVSAIVRPPLVPTIFYNYITNEAFQARFLVLASRK